MAKEDNYTLYKTLFNKNKEKIPNFIFNVDENINSTDIANHFKILHGDKFIYQNDKLY